MTAAPMTKSPLTKPTIALIDDDQNILASVSLLMEAEGYDVRTYSDGESGLAGVLAKPVDLIILDIKMPRLNGLEVLARLRKTAKTPVIFLTSKDEEEDELQGLELGADDYIRKPFSQSLLTARVRAVLRRREEASIGTAAAMMVRGHLALDEQRHLSVWKGEPIDLTVTEFEILKALAIRPGHVKSRDQLLDAAYGESGFVDDRTIDSHIKRLRKKFKAVDADFSAIETLYGVGYRFNAG